MEHVDSFLNKKAIPTELAISLVADLVVRNVVCMELSIGDATSSGQYLVTSPLLMAPDFVKLILKVIIP